MHGFPYLIHVMDKAGDNHVHKANPEQPARPWRTSRTQLPGLQITTAFHEAGHSTGHSSRLNRPGIAAFDHFGSDKYAREELVAQMTASILCVETAIDNPAMFENSAGYIGGWLSALNRDHRLVVTAAAQAQRACDLITQAEHEATRDASDHQGASVAEGETALSTGRKAPADPLYPRYAQAQREGPAVERGDDPASHRRREASRGAQGTGTVTRPAADLDGGSTNARPEVPRWAKHAEGSVEQAQPMNRTADWQAEPS
jgi:hypothetical protein